MFAVELKHCGPCGLDRPAHAFYFHNGKAWGKCKDCSREYAKQRQMTHKQYARWREENPERYRETARKSAYLWRKKNPKKWDDTVRKACLKRDYGLTTKDYEALVEKQHNKCALCGANHVGDGKNRAGKPHRYWQVDHCHKTGVVRGLLCLKCNTRIGAYERLRDTVGLESVEQYLAKSLN